ncbi:MAG: hypothetical protein Q8L81_11270 [Bacteroidota bacterium]|nr:hypothetical protein [Bacteroidota bacterium]
MVTFEAGQIMELKKYKYINLFLFLEDIRKLSVKNDFNARLSELLTKQKTNEDFQKELKNFTPLFLEKAFFVNAFTDYGINSSLGFFSELIKRIKYKFFPPLTNKTELSNFLSFLFGNKNNDWVNKIDEANWSRIFSFLILKNSYYQTNFNMQIKNALVILSHRLVTLGVDPYIVLKLPEADDTHSPFFELNRAINEFVETEDNSTEKEQKSTVVLIELHRCEKIFQGLVAEKDNMGTSLHLTFLIKRAEQHIKRIRILMHIFSADKEIKDTAAKKLAYSLLKADAEKYSVKNFIRTNTGLLASRIMSHTSEKGEDYIGFSRNENKKLFRSSMGGGLIIVFLVFIKHYIHQLQLSLFFEGILFGLNYGFGFVLMHFLHFTLATKQPAMTASYIAGNLGDKNNRANVAFVLKQIIKSQFISLAGNLIIVLPLCFLIAFTLKYFFHYQFFDYTVADQQFQSNHPLLSLSLFYAFITGIFLTLAGIITGYYDNKVVFADFAERIKKHPRWSQNYSPVFLSKIGTFVEKNLGAIIGNMFLGLILGGAGNIGIFLGLPFDIRHVTVSSGNFGFALGSIYVYHIAELITIFIGILLIGIINVFSSFLFSFIIACTSRNLSAKESIKILYVSLIAERRKN